MNPLATFSVVVPSGFNQISKQRRSFSFVVPLDSVKFSELTHHVFGVQAIGIQAIGVQAIGVRAIGVQAIGVQATGVRATKLNETL